MKLVTVIVPVYNVEKYLSKCIRSIMEQSYRELEIILVDDGSTDNSLSICKRYSQMDKRIRLFHTDNYGLSHARNVGINHSNGEYVVFVDSDDYISKDMILLMMNKSENADLVICNYKKVADNEEVHQSKRNINNEIWNFKKFWYEYYYDGLSGFCGVAWNKLYKKKLFKDIRYPIGKIHEDEYAICPITRRTNEIKVISESLYYYVQRSNSIVHGNSKGSFDKADAFLKRCNYFTSPDLLQIAEENLLSVPFHLVMGLFEENNNKMSKKIYVSLRADYFFFVKRYLKRKLSIKLILKSLMLFVPRVYLFILREKNNYYDHLH